jgi:hypothetical protein
MTQPRRWQAPLLLPVLLVALLGMPRCTRGQTCGSQAGGYPPHCSTCPIGTPCPKTTCSSMAVSGAAGPAMAGSGCKALYVASQPATQHNRPPPRAQMNTYSSSTIIATSVLVADPLDSISPNVCRLPGSSSCSTSSVCQGSIKTIDLGIRTANFSQPGAPQGCRCTAPEALLGGGAAASDAALRAQRRGPGAAVTAAGQPLPQGHRDGRGAELPVPQAC